MRRDFERLLTERRNPRTSRIDALPVPGILAAINREDAAIARAVRRELRDVGRAVDLVERRLRRGGRLLFVGAGTSGRLGVLEAAELPPTFDTAPGQVEAVMAGGRDGVWASREGAEDKADEGGREMRALKVGPRDVVVGITASGVTPFVHGALGEAKRRRAGRVLVACNREGVPRGAADVLVAVEVGPEVIAGSTRLRAATATKMILNMITVAAMIRLGKVYGNLMVDLQTRSAKLVARATRIVRTAAGVDDATAARALLDAGGKAKVAVVMLRGRVSRAEAERRLARAGGLLRKALGE